MSQDKVSHYNLDHARGAEQAAKMRALSDEDACFFCSNTPTAPRAVIHETAHWSVAHNDYPYAGTRLHLLLAPFAHVADLLDLDREVQDDLWNALAWVRGEFDLAYYSVGVRCGDCRATGGTIAHVHVHLVVGDVDQPDHQPVRFKMSSRRTG